MKLKKLLIFLISFLTLSSLCSCDSLFEDPYTERFSLNYEEVGEDYIKTIRGFRKPKTNYCCITDIHFEFHDVDESETELYAKIPKTIYLEKTNETLQVQFLESVYQYTYKFIDFAIYPSNPKEDYDYYRSQCNFHVHLDFNGLSCVYNSYKYNVGFWYYYSIINPNNNITLYYQSNKFSYSEVGIKDLAKGIITFPATFREEPFTWKDVYNCNTYGSDYYKKDSLFELEDERISSIDFRRIDDNRRIIINQITYEFKDVDEEEIDLYIKIPNSIKAYVNKGSVKQFDVFALSGLKFGKLNFKIYPKEINTDPDYYRLQKNFRIHIDCNGVGEWVSKDSLGTLLKYTILDSNKQVIYSTETHFNMTSEKDNHDYIFPTTYNEWTPKE